MTPVFLTFGWRGAFWFTGVTGLAWIVLWQILSRRKELQKVAEHTAAETANRPSWRDPRFWSFACIYAFGATRWLPPAATGATRAG